MKKQSGFTLIELMVVMAIIAILATAGLAAYTGYIKKARDTTRIADLGAINSIVLADMSSDGLPPAVGDIVSVISAANNGQAISDPLGTGNCHDAVVTSGTGSATCSYSYDTCASGTGYVIYALFESPSNTSMYSDNNSGTIGAATGTNYDIGSCSTGSVGGTPATL